MGYSQFAATKYLIDFDTDEEVRIGSHQTVRSGELECVYVDILLYNVANRANTEKIRINIYSDPEHSALLYQSEWAELTKANIPEIDDDHSWIGWIRCDFNRENINHELTYYLSCEIASYTRNADTFYFGLFYDFPYPIYDNNQNSFRYHPLAHAVFLHQERT